MSNEQTIMQDQVTVETTPALEGKTVEEFDIMQQAIQHTALSFGDAVDTMVNNLISRNNITPSINSLTLDVKPPESGVSSGWRFELKHDGARVGAFEVGLHVFELEEVLTSESNGDIKE